MTGTHRVQPESPVGALTQRLAERVAGREREQRGQLRGERSLDAAGGAQLADQAAAREQVIPCRPELAGARLGQRRTSGTGDGVWTAPARSRRRSGRSTTALGPARSWLRVTTDRPSLMATCATVQPACRDRMHGTSDVGGTDCASSHSDSRSPQPRPGTHRRAAAEASDGPGWSCLP